LEARVKKDSPLVPLEKPEDCPFPLHVDTQTSKHPSQKLAQLQPNQDRVITDVWIFTTTTNFTTNSLHMSDDSSSESTCLSSTNSDGSGFVTWTSGDVLLVYTQNLTVGFCLQTYGFTPLNFSYITCVGSDQNGTFINNTNTGKDITQLSRLEFDCTNRTFAYTNYVSGVFTDDIPKIIGYEYHYFLRLFIEDIEENMWAVVVIGNEDNTKLLCE